MKPFREMNKTVIGTLGISLILSLVAIGFNADKLPVIGGGKIYQAEFAEAAGLHAQDEVRVAGVKVGKVISLDLAGDRVLVRMRLKDVSFGNLSRADIRIKTVLGRKFVALQPAGDGEMEPGSTIPLDRTSAPFDVSDAFQGLATTVGKIDDQQLAKAFETLSATFQNTPNDVRASLTGLSRLSRTIASRDDQLKALLTRSRGVTKLLADRDPALVTFLSNSSLVLQELQSRKAAIDALLASTVELSQQLEALVRENRATLAPALAQLRGVVQVLRQNEANIDSALPRLAAFTRIFSNNLGNGRWFDTLTNNLVNPTGFAPGPFPSPAGGK